MLGKTELAKPLGALDNFEVVLPYRYAPRASSGFLVVRKDLLRHLTEASLLKQLSIVRGPAGSGKTTLLTQWRDVCREMDRPVAWLTIDAADKDLTRLVGGLANAIEYAGCAELAVEFRAVCNKLADLPIIQVAQLLASLCNKSETRLVFVLDQFEAMDGHVAGEILSGFLQHAITARVVIASRIRPTIPLGSLRARDQLFEIGPSDLNLTPLETRSAFDEDVPELYTRRLHYETSGEAVAVGFARRVIDELPRDMVGTENWQERLHEYYRSEILDTLPLELREAMSRLVVVERFDLSLASALIGGNATAMIERLHHIDGLLLRRRGTQEFYFSEMLRRFLEVRLAWLDDEEHATLHQRAASWFSRRGRNAEALRHAIAAGDREQALALLDQIGYANLVAQQGPSATHQLLDAIGVATDAASPRALLSLAVVHCQEGDVELAVTRVEEARQYIAAAERQVDPGVDDQLVLAEALLAGFRDETLNAATEAALVRYLASAPESEHESRAQAQIFLSWDRFCHGDIIGAEALTDAAAQEYAETEGVYGCIFMHVHRTLARYWRNDLDRALKEITLAEQMTWIFFPEDQRLRAMTGLLRAGLLFELGRPDPLTDVTALVGTVGALESWTEIQIWSHVHGARAALAQGRSSEARGILAYGLEVARRIDSSRLAWNLGLAGIEISIRVRELDRALEESAGMALRGAAFLKGADSYLTWQERIGGVLVAVRLAEEQKDFDEAKKMIALARSMIDETSAARFAVELEIAEARLAHRQGDSEAVSCHIANARELCGETLPVRLLLDAGEDLGTHQPDLSPWAPASVQMDPSVAEPARTGSRDPLTPRERQILLVMGEGHPNKVAAYRLGLSEATVKFHLRNIYRKLHAQNRTQALARYRSLADR